MIHLTFARKLSAFSEHRRNIYEVACHVPRSPQPRHVVRVALLGSCLVQRGIHITPNREVLHVILVRLKFSPKSYAVVRECISGVWGTA